ncbi:MAG: MFS transporter [Lachnospiraceae bacterium]
MNQKEKNANKIAIVSGSLMLMSSIVISAILANIKENFPEAGVGTVQLVLTIPSLMGMLFAFIAGPLSSRIAKKHLFLGGMSLGLLGGIIAFFIGPHSLIALFISSALIGINQGMNGSLTKALVSDFFEGQERSNMMGFQASASTAGSILLTFSAGLLSGMGWKWSYAILFLFIPLIVIVQRNLTLVPITKVETTTKTKSKEKLNAPVFFTAIILCFCFLFSYTYQLNISLFIQSSGLGTSVTAGYANAIFSGAAMLMGLMFGKITKVLGNKTMMVGMLTAAVGFLGIKFIGTLPAAFFSSFCCGVAQAFTVPMAALIVSRYAPDSVRTNGIAITNGLLNFGMFCSPYLMNNVANTLGGDEVSVVSSKFMVAGIGLIALAIVYAFLMRVFYPNKKEI